MLCRFVSVAAALFLSVVPVFGQGFATAEFNGSVVDQCANCGQPEFDEALACQPRMLQLGFRFAF